MRGKPDRAARVGAVSERIVVKLGRSALYSMRDFNWVSGSISRLIEREVKRAVEEEREASAVRWRELVGAASELRNMMDREHGEAEAEDALLRLDNAIRGCVLR